MKPSKFAGHPPRTNKGTLTILAKAQTAKAENLDPDIAAALQRSETMAKELAEKTFSEQPQVPEESTAAAAPAPAAPTEVTPAPVAPKPTGLYALGKKYAPKTDRNSETWGKLTKALVDGPKSMKELNEVVKGHGDFLGYMTRGGHIVPHVPKVEEAAVS